MPHPPFRFVHASDFHLERPLSGVAEIPGHLRDLFLDAPYLAAEKVFEAVVLEGAAFLILSGDILHPLYAGPRGIVFLSEQFEKLAKRGIEVFWAGGSVDTLEAWPAAIPLPGNVHLFPRGRVDEFLIQIDGVPTARILGTSGDGRQPIRAGEFHPDSTGLATVAVVYGEADASLASRGIDYWALGGRHDRQTVGRDVSVSGSANRNAASYIHYSGSPQGRRPSESGVHGCTLVQVDEQNQLRTNLIPCDAARWLAERIVIEPTTTREDLESRLRDRLRLLHDSTDAAKKVELVSTETTMESPATLAFPQPGATATPAVRQPGQTELLVSWMLIGEGPLSRELRRGRLTGELLDGLRGEFGFNSPVAWSVGIETEPTDAFPREWLEQETIRGDFLRAIGELKLNAGESLDLENYLSETHRSGSLASAALLEGPERRRVLEEAALLGVELLGGNDEC